MPSQLLVMGEPLISMHLKGILQPFDLFLEEVVGAMPVELLILVRETSSE